MGMKNENFFVVQGWMRNELNLKGNDLLVYAIIYGFSQDEESKFEGSLQYLADWCGATKQGIKKNLNNLLEAGLIKKETKKCSRGNLVSYYTTKFHPYETKFHTPMKLSFPNNIDKDNIDNKIEKTNNKIISTKSSSKKLVKKKSLYESCMDLINLYTKDKPEIYDLLVQYLNLRLEMKEKSLYKNQWKGILNKLDTIHEDTGDSYEDIIQFNIEKGYASFFPIPKYSGSKKKKAYDEEVSCEQYTEEEKKQIKKWQKEMEAKGVRVVY